MGFMKKQREEAAPEDAEAEAPAPEETADPEEAEQPPEGDSSAPDEEAAGPGDTAEKGDSKEGEGGSDWPDQLTPEQQDEFERAVTALYDVLYKNPDTGKAVLDQIVQDEEPQVKVEAAARAATLLVQQLDEKLNLSNEIMPYFVVTVVDRLLELAEKVKKVKFDDNDTMAVLSATSDGVRALFSGDQGGGASPPAQQQGAPPVPAEQAPPDAAAPPEAA